MSKNRQPKGVSCSQSDHTQLPRVIPTPHQLLPSQENGFDLYMKIGVKPAIHLSPEVDSCMDHICSQDIKVIDAGLICIILLCAVEDCMLDRLEKLEANDETNSHSFQLDIDDKQRLVDAIDIIYGILCSPASEYFR